MTRFFSLYPLILRTVGLCALCFPVFAWAGGGARTDDDDPNINARGVVINNILTILRAGPDSASDACLKSLSEMHKVQEQLDKEETAQESSDIGLVRDVLESDMEGVISSCGVDAHEMCRTPQLQADATLSRLCHRLPDITPSEASDDLQ